MRRLATRVTLSVFAGAVASALLGQTPAAAPPAAKDELERSVTLMAKIGNARLARVLAGRKADRLRLQPRRHPAGLDRRRRAGGYPELVTALRRSGRRSSTWSPDGSWLAFTLAPGGGMNEQVYLVRPDGTGVEAADRRRQGDQPARRLDAATAGSSRSAPTAADGAAIDAYLYDVGVGHDRASSPRTAASARFTDLSRDGKRALLNRLVSRGDNNLYLVDLATGEGDAPDAARGAGQLLRRRSRRTAAPSISRRTRTATAPPSRA